MTQPFDPSTVAPDIQLVVELQSEGDEEIGQFAPISEPTTVIVSSVAEAQQECRKYINEWELRAGNWSGGRVTDLDGNFVAYISYNGRAWATLPDGSRPNRTLSSGKQRTPRRSKQR